KFVIRSTARNLLAIQGNIAQRRQFTPFTRSVFEATKALKERLVADGAIDKAPCQAEGGHQVAILSETSTSLGASVERVDRPTDDQCVDIFRYSREIAALRNAYGASNAQNPTSGDKAAGPRPSLSVNLTDTTNRSDEPPDFSKVQSPLSQEAA